MPSSQAEDERYIRRVADELFIATDRKDWAAVRALFVDGPIDMDMTSLVGGQPVRVSADELVAGFRAGLHGGKATHHLATNYQVQIAGGRAELWAHGYAWNQVPALGAGADLWETWGNYRLGFRREQDGWRLEAFRYYSKLTRGNDAVRTHAG